MSSNSPDSGDKTPVKPLELPPDYSKKNGVGGSKKWTVLVVLVILGIVVIGAFLGGVFDPPKAQPTDRSMKFH